MYLAVGKRRVKGVSCPSPAMAELARQAVADLSSQVRSQVASGSAWVERDELHTKPVDVNGLTGSALLAALNVNDGLKKMHTRVAKRIVAERAERPFESVADLLRRVNRHAAALNERLGKKFLPYLHVSPPECRTRGNFSPTGRHLGGMRTASDPSPRLHCARAPSCSQPHTLQCSLQMRASRCRPP